MNEGETFETSDPAVPTSMEGFSKFKKKTGISETIFDKYTYKRLGTIQKAQKEYFYKLKKLETDKFKMYPE